MIDKHSTKEVTLDFDVLLKLMDNMKFNIIKMIECNGKLSNWNYQYNYLQYYAETLDGIKLQSQIAGEEFLRDLKSFLKYTRDVEL